MLGRGEGEGEVEEEEEEKAAEAGEEYEVDPATPHLRSPYTLPPLSLSFSPSLHQVTFDPHLPLRSMTPCRLYCVYYSDGVSGPTRETESLMEPYGRHHFQLA